LTSEKKQPETVAKVVAEGVGSEKNQPKRVREVVEGDQVRLAKGLGKFFPEFMVRLLFDSVSGGCEFIQRF